MSRSEPIRIEVNGEPSTVPRGHTVAALLAALGRDPRTVAIEHNGVILARRRYAETALGAGDRLEIVQFVQGG